MVSELAIEDIERIQREGGTVHPRDVIRLNALGLRITNNPENRLAVMPRVVCMGELCLREPTIKQDMFLDECNSIFTSDPATYLLVQCWVLAHRNDDINDDLLKTPKKFLKTIKKWVKDDLADFTMNQIDQAVTFVRFGCDPDTNEFPIYMIKRIQEEDANERAIGEQKSWVLANYLHSTTLGIDSAAALRATSPQLSAMIERAYIVSGFPMKDNEQAATADYYQTLDYIKKNAFDKADDGVNKENAEQTEVN